MEHYGKKKKILTKRTSFLYVNFLVIVKKMAFNSSGFRHPHERSALPAINILDTIPGVNFKSGRFFIQETEFESRAGTITFQFWKIQALCSFVKDNYQTIISTGFIHGDLRMYSYLLHSLLDKGIQNPKGMFGKVCFHYPLDFLIMFDCFRENASENFDVSV